ATHRAASTTGQHVVDLVGAEHDRATARDWWRPYPCSGTGWGPWLTTGTGPTATCLRTPRWAVLQATGGGMDDYSRLLTFRPGYRFSSPIHATVRHPGFTHTLEIGD